VETTDDTHHVPSTVLESGALSNGELLALELWAAGYSLEQIGYLLSLRTANDSEAPESSDATTITAARTVLGRASLRLGCITIEEAVTEAHRRRLISGARYRL
jgi:hypothetical protein